MSRASAGDTVVVKPTNNVYTALAAFACVVVIMATVALWMRSETLFGPGGLLAAPERPAGRR